MGLNQVFRPGYDTAGFVAAGFLRGLSRLPPRIVVKVGSPLLPVYRFFRPHWRRRWSDLSRAVPLAWPSLAQYYRMRLRLATLALRQLTGHVHDQPIRCIGAGHYHAALASGRPLALVGWHQGPVELLHRLPQAPADGRPFLVLTASAFAAPLTRFLAAGRRQPGKQVVLESALHSSLRAWVRHRGVLAFMADQIPGQPRDFFTLWGSLRLPYAAALVEFCARHQAMVLPVHTRLDRNEVIFEIGAPLNAPAPSALKEGLQRAMEKALAEAPDQYNWSYRKIHVV